MSFDITAYKRRTGPIVVDDLDLTHFEDHPLADPVLRCISAMHDVEYHTVCYLRDLLVTPGARGPGDHRVPRVLEPRGVLARRGARGGAHGARPGSRCRQGRGAPSRARRARSDPAADLIARVRARRRGLHRGAHDVGGHQRVVRAGELRAARPRAPTTRCSPSSSSGSCARRVVTWTSTRPRRRKRLAASARARRLTRFAMRSFWRPVGSGVIPPGGDGVPRRVSLRRRRRWRRDAAHRSPHATPARASTGAPPRRGRRRALLAA